MSISLGQLEPARGDESALGHVKLPVLTLHREGPQLEAGLPRERQVGTERSLGPLNASLDDLLKKPIPVKAAGRAPRAASGSQTFYWQIRCCSTANFLNSTPYRYVPRGTESPLAAYSGEFVHLFRSKATTHSD